MDVASTTRRDRGHDREEEKRSSKMANVTVLSPDGGGRHQRAHEEQPHARATNTALCNLAEDSREPFRRRNPADDVSSDDSPPDKKESMPKKKSGKKNDVFD